MSLDIRYSSEIGLEIRYDTIAICISKEETRITQKPTIMTAAA